MIEPVTVISLGSPVTRFRPHISRESSVTYAEAIFFLISSALFSPITKFISFVICWMIASSKRFPPTGISRLNTMPPKDNTEISAVFAPISTTSVPVDFVISRFMPSASAIGFSTTCIFFDLRFVLAIRSK